MKYDTRSETPAAIKDFLDEQVLRYNNASFIEKDPVSIPHSFTKKEDIEISGFLAATIAWGNRRSIIKNAQNLMNLMDHSPHQFVIHHSKKDLKPLENFVHRTFNGDDCVFFIRSLKYIYSTCGGLEKAFECKDITGSLKYNITAFRQLFLRTPHLPRSEKHISDPSAKSPAKRICMFLRWMVRNDKKGVDFGLWKNITSAELCLPLDVHTGNVSRTLGLLKRKQNDWRAVEEITGVLRKMDPEDPVKYDYALFGIGVNNML
jgi:uncharacterized protein (TIGR02757 family)